MAHHSPFCFSLLALNFFVILTSIPLSATMSAFHLASHKNDLTDYQISQMLFSMDEDNYELFILISCSPFANVYTCLKLLLLLRRLVSHTLLHLRTQRLAFWRRDHSRVQNSTLFCGLVVAFSAVFIFFGITSFRCMPAIRILSTAKKMNPRQRNLHLFNLKQCGLLALKSATRARGSQTFVRVRPVS